MTPAVRNAILAFVIAAALFGAGFWVSSAVNGVRLSDIRTIEEQIATDTLSLETQFDLLSSLACEDITENSVLSSELNDLSKRLDYTEGQLGSTNPTVILLKRQYSLLEIKDYLLMQQVAAKCHLKPVFILYFYSNKGDCADCDTAGNVLTYLRETYPQLRVYSFDYNLDVGALQTLIQIHNIKDDLPAFIIDGKTYYALSARADIEKVLPLSKLSTSTPAKK